MTDKIKCPLDVIEDCELLDRLNEATARIEMLECELEVSCKQRAIMVLDAGEHRMKAAAQRDLRVSIQDKCERTLATAHKMLTDLRKDYIFIADREEVDLRMEKIQLFIEESK